MSEVEQLLSKAPLVEAKTRYGLSALGLAAAAGNPEMVQLLLVRRCSLLREVRRVVTVGTRYNPNTAQH